MGDENRIIVYKRALEAAERERLDVLNQLQILEELQKRSTVLDATISNLKTLIGEFDPDQGVTSSVAGTETPTTATREVEQPLVQSKAADLLDVISEVETGLKRFEQIEQILTECNRWMTFAEIGQEFKKRGWHFSSEQTLRNAVTRKDEAVVEKGKDKIFVKKDNKVGLVKWREETSVIN
ncbi:MAG: hypothetical protein WB930_19760 [Syntrophobacteraceae bacterium]